MNSNCRLEGIGNETNARRRTIVAMIKINRTADDHEIKQESQPNPKVKFELPRGRRWEGVEDEDDEDWRVNSA